MINSIKKINGSQFEGKIFGAFSKKILNPLSRLTKSEDGVGAVEFALIDLYFLSFMSAL